MRVVKLLSWHAEIAAKAKTLRRKGVTVDASPLERTSRVVTEMAEMSPAAVVLDMDRLPSSCREVALMMRASKSARHIPILFAGSLAPDGVDGLPEKYARLREELPDVPYVAWADAVKALAKLLDEPMTAPPMVPPARVYTASLAQKLGIVSASIKGAGRPREVALLGAPEGFVELLGDLPETVRLVERLSPATQLAVSFIRSLGDLAATLEVMTYRLPEGGSAWIAYPKKGRGRMGDFSENHVREMGLKAGWMDYKICSIDDAWSGMKFAKKKE